MMSAKLFEKYYKRGFDHFIFKHVMGLHKPDIKTGVFYFLLIIAMFIIGEVIS